MAADAARRGQGRGHPALPRGWSRTRPEIDGRRKQNLAYVLPGRPGGGDFEIEIAPSEALVQDPDRSFDRSFLDARAEQLALAQPEAEGDGVQRVIGRLPGRLQHASCVERRERVDLLELVLDRVDQAG